MPARCAYMYVVHCFSYGTVCSSTVLLLSRKHHQCLAEEQTPKRTSKRSVAMMTMRPNVLQEKFGWMNRHVPCFGVHGDRITVINQPGDFYETFKVNTFMFFNDDI